MTGTIPLRRMLVAVFTCLLLSPRAHAGPAPLYSRGILEYNNGRFTEAARYLDKASREMPGDFDSRFYLGVARFETRRYTEALEAFEKASALDTTDPRCPFYEGLCRLALGNGAGAIEALDRARELDPSYAPLAQFYSGVANARMGRRDDARDRFLQAMRHGEVSSDLYAACERALLALDRGRRKMLSFSCSARYEYDSNVSLAPDDTDIIAASGKDDFRFLTTADILFVPIIRPRFELSSEYLFTQSVHNRLGDFNLQGHSLVNTALFKLGLLQPFCGYEYDYYFLDDNKRSFLRTNAIFAGFNLLGGGRALTQFNYRYARDDFFYTPVDPDLRRDAHNNRLGFDQYIFFGGGRSDFFRFGFYYDRNSAEGDTFMYNGFAFTGELYKALFAGIVLDASAQYYLRDFPRDNRRDRDNRQTYNFALSRALNEYLDVGFNYNLIVNDSGDPFFEFDRNIFTIFCAAAY